MNFSLSKTAEAVSALKAYQTKLKENSSRSQLFDEDDQQFVYLTITTKKFLSDKKVLKPKRINIPHSIYTQGETSICIFTKDPQRSYKDVLQGPDSQTRDVIQRVVGISKLKGKFKPFEARRQLLDSFDLFLAEGSVVTTLPRLLGKTFYSSNKIPLSVDLSTKEEAISDSRAKEEITKLLHSTFAVLNAGNTITVRVGRFEFSDNDISENAQAVVDYFVKNIVKNGWDGIRAVNIKTSKSPSLPVFLTEKIYGENDILKEDAEGDTAGKRKREPKPSKLETLLAEVVDEEDLEKHFKKRPKKSDEKLGKKVDKKGGDMEEQSKEDEKKDEEHDEEQAEEQAEKQSKKVKADKEPQSKKSSKDTKTKKLTKSKK
jgi:ribosomal protein L1